MGPMTLFAVLLFVAAGIAVLATLAMGLVNLAKTDTNEGAGPGPDERALRSNKLMRQRIIFQGVAIAALAIIILIASAKS
jgi:multisubunit Na+/H+ antiporter MnhB subunit